MHGESFAKITKKAILQEEPKGSDLGSKDRYETAYAAAHNERQNRRFCTSSHTIIPAP